MSVALISTVVGKTPENIPYSFVFDEMYSLSKMGVKINVVRPIVEKRISFLRYEFLRNETADRYSSGVLGSKKFENLSTKGAH